MHGKVNCIHNNQGAWCTCTEVKRSLWGLGVRCCVMYPPLNGAACANQRETKRPAMAPPPQLNRQ